MRAVVQIGRPDARIDRPRKGPAVDRPGKGAFVGVFRRVRIVVFDGVVARKLGDVRGITVGVGRRARTRIGERSRRPAVEGI